MRPIFNRQGGYYGVSGIQPWSVKGLIVFQEAGRDGNGWVERCDSYRDPVCVSVWVWERASERERENRERDKNRGGGQVSHQNAPCLEVGSQGFWNVCTGNCWSLNTLPFFFTNLHILSLSTSLSLSLLLCHLHPLSLGFFGILHSLLSLSPPVCSDSWPFIMNSSNQPGPKHTVFMWRCSSMLRACSLWDEKMKRGNILPIYKRKGEQQEYNLSSVSALGSSCLPSTLCIWCFDIRASKR